MEQNTSYANGIANLLKSYPTFEKIYQYNIDNYPRQFPYGQIFEALASGTTVITGSDLLMSYMATYGGHHYHKLSTSLPILLQKIPNGAIVDIIDYGCGQALASVVLIDYLIKNGRKITINSVTLIEPSKAAIERGELHLAYFLKAYNQSTNVKIVNNGLDNVILSNLTTKKENIKIHLFSNILDVDNFDIGRLYNNIVNTQTGTNYFLCVSPYNPTRQRLVDFVAKFQNKTLIGVEQGPIQRKVFNIQTKQFQDSYKITMIQRLFSCIF